MRDAPGALQGELRARGGGGGAEPSCAELRGGATCALRLFPGAVGEQSCLPKSRSRGITLKIPLSAEKDLKKIRQR